MSHDPHACTPLERGLMLLALGTLVAACARCVARTHCRREANRSPAPAYRIQTWEAEGGRPVDEAMTPDSPSPAVPAR
jgi:hypothetical protein